MTLDPLAPSSPFTARRAVDVEAPFDDDWDVPAWDGSLALALPLPLPLALPLPLPLPEQPPPEQPPPVPPLHVVPPLPAEPPPEDEDEDDFDPVRTPRAALPAPRPVAARLVRALLEVLAGDRPVAQLARWLSEEVYADVESRVCPGAPRPWAGTLRRVSVCEPGEGVAEAVAVVRRGARSGAIALRLEGLDGHWRVTALDLL